MPVPRDEQETILNYCPIEKRWYIYTDVPSHIRKYKDLVVPTVIQKENGEIVAINGELNGTVSIRKKTVMSEEQKKAAAERLKQARQKGQS